MVIDKLNLLVLFQLESFTYYLSSLECGNTHTGILLGFANMEQESPFDKLRVRRFERRGIYRRMRTSRHAKT